jgi:hypothetical protein
MNPRPAPETRRSTLARLRRIAPNAIAFVVLGVLAAILASRSVEVARTLGLEPDPWGHRLLVSALFVAMGSFLAALHVLLRELWKAGREFLALRRAREDGATFAESGVVMVEFTLLAPTVWWIMAMVVQMALIAQASIVVRYSAFAAARTAIVRLERDSFPYLSEELSLEASKVERTAELVLCSLSPRTPGTSDDSAHAMRSIFESQDGVWGDRNFHERDEYSRAATSVDVEVENPPFEIFGYSLPLPIGDIFSPSLVEVEVRYLYMTKIPGMTLIPGVTVLAPNGGKAFPITQIVRMQGTGARQTNPLTSLNPLAGDPFP